MNVIETETYIMTKKSTCKGILTLDKQSHCYTQWRIQDLTLGARTLSTGRGMGGRKSSKVLKV